MMGQIVKLSSRCAAAQNVCLLLGMRKNGSLLRQGSNLVLLLSKMVLVLYLYIDSFFEAWRNIDEQRDPKGRWLRGYTTLGYRDMIAQHGNPYQWISISCNGI